MLKITDAKFITSAASRSQFIAREKPIIAVCGKSNVGKSSFINMLSNRKKLAKVSKEPGRTRLINYFDLGAFILADLPGYGFAKVSKSEKERWARLMDDFFSKGKNCDYVFALCDVRHPPTADDIDMVKYLYANLIPFTVIATKADKLSRLAANKGAGVIASCLGCGVQDIIITSSQNRTGLEKVLERAESVVENFNTSPSESDNAEEDNSEN